MNETPELTYIDFFLPEKVKALDANNDNATLIQYNLVDHNAANHRWYHFLKMRTEEMLLISHFDSDIALLAHMTLHTALIHQTTRTDARERQNIEPSDETSV